MHSTHVGDLDIPTLPPEAKIAHLVPDLQNHSLLGVGRLCDAGCTCTFDKNTVTITYDNQTVLTGHRDTYSRLWRVKLPNCDPHMAGAIDSPRVPELVRYSHGALFSPTLNTLEKALRNNYIVDLPGLTTQTLRRHPPNTPATAKGHMDQVRQNIKSTKKRKKKSKPSSPEPTDNDVTDEAFPQSDAPNIRTHDCYVTIEEMTGQIHTDQTGRFPTPSSAGNNYVMVLYDYDSNAILVQPFKTRHDTVIKEAYAALLERLQRAGLRPRLQRLDNECSKILKEYMHDQSIDFQLAPPGMHRRNAAERAIRTFKNHFIAGLSSTDPNFPLYLWDLLLPQAEMSLNLLRGSRINPKLSACAQVFGQYDYNRTPIAPPGTKVVVHEKPHQRGSWDPHGKDGYYVGPAMESYRCYTVWVTKTRRTRIADTVSWFPHSVPMPVASTNDIIMASLADIANALLNPAEPGPTRPLNTSQRETLQQVTKTLHQLYSPQADTSELEPKTDDTAPLRVEESDAPLRVEEEDGDDEVATIPEADEESVTESEDEDSIIMVPADTTPSPEPTDSPRPHLIPPTQEEDEPTPTPTPAPTRKQRRNRKKNVARRMSRRRKRQAAANSLLHDLPPEGTTLEDAFQVEHWALHGQAINPDTGKSAEYLELLKSSEGDLWEESNCEEIGRLAQGLGEGSSIPKGTNTIFFMERDKVPKGRSITYLRCVVADRPEKPQPRRVRWTVGGNLVDYDGDCSTKTADITTTKLLINSVLSTPNAKYMTLDLKDFYLGTPMQPPQCAYMKVRRRYIPQKIIDLYNLESMFDQDGYIYVEIRRGMCGLPQAGRIASDQLMRLLKPARCVPCDVTHGLWKHTT